MAAIRRAEVSWSGDLASGSGTVSAVSSHAFDSLPVSWAARTESPEGKTSPEELIAAAVGSCFAMSLAGELTSAKTPPELISVDATCVVDEVAGSHLVTEVQLDVRARVPDIDEAEFARIARKAEEGCTMAALVRGSATVTLTASLASD